MQKHEHFYNNIGCYLLYFISAHMHIDCCGDTTFFFQILYYKEIDMDTCVFFVFAEILNTSHYLIDILYYRTAFKQKSYISSTCIFTMIFYNWNFCG